MVPNPEGSERLRLGLWLLTVVLLSVCGCGLTGQAPVGLRIWAQSEDSAITTDSRPETQTDLFSAADRTIRLESAIGETASFQLAFRSDAVAEIIDEISAQDAVREDGARIPADRIRFFRQVRIALDQYPGWYLRLTPHLRENRLFGDVLVPLAAPRGALPIDLRPGVTEAVWCDVQVPLGTAPGSYRCRLSVRPRGGWPASLTLNVEVWPFALPQAGHMHTLVGLRAGRLFERHLDVAGRPYSPQRLSGEDPMYPKAAALLVEALRLLHDHRCTAMVTDVQPARAVGADGGLTLDWTDYDRLMGPAIDGSGFDDRIGAGLWPMPITSTAPDPGVYGGWGSPGHERMLIDYLRLSVAHFLQKGWMNRHFVRIAVPAADPAEAYRQFEWLGGVLRAADTRLATVCPLPPQSMAPYGWTEHPFKDVSPLTSIWAVQAQYADRRQMAAQLEAGKRLWLEPSRPPYSGSLCCAAPPADARSLAWQAYLLGCEALLIADGNDWPDSERQAGAASERCLIWPGKPFGLDRPVPSVRLKRLRRGAQDREYLWLLERHGSPGLARRFAGDLFAFGGTDCYVEHFLDGRAGGWVTDPAAWALARRVMARELAASMPGGAKARAAATPEDGPGLARHELDWARYTETVRRVRVDVEGVRVRPAEGGSPGLEAVVSVFNATPRPVGGIATFAGTPAGWQPAGDPNPITALEPLRFARRIVRALASEIEPNPDGVVSTELTFTLTDGRVIPAPGRLCLLTAQSLPEAPVLDGRLDDWPLGTTNVAGDFVLVGAADVPKQGRPSPDRASQQTVVLVGHHGQDLYLAFNCRDDHPGGRSVSRSNQVRYDDLWPVGEDLVEVLLDPTGRAVSAGELLHIVVKANGAVIAERGAACLRVLGQHGDWPARIAAAVDDRASSNAWTVEIRIPMAALGPHEPLMGVNFGRFHAGLGEYSSWSGARRQLYSPSSLGNMRLELSGAWRP